MFPILFELPIDFSYIHSALPTSASLHTYGLMIALGFLIGMQLSAREARRVDRYRNTNFDQFVLDLIFGILLSSMAGARLLYVFVEWNRGTFGSNPLRVFYIWQGGLVFYGGLIGAIIFSVYYCWRKKRDFFVVADTLIPQVSLGQFFGRLGCLAAGCCWGERADGHPLAVRFPKESLIYKSTEHPVDHPGFTFEVHPVQLYESFGNLALFFLLILLRTQKRFNGMVLVGYLVGYSILRYTVETMRGDDVRGVGVLGLFSTSQLISMILFGVAVAIFVFQWRKRQRISLAAA